MSTSDAVKIAVSRISIQRWFSLSLGFIYNSVVLLNIVLRSSSHSFTSFVLLLSASHGFASFSSQAPSSAPRDSNIRTHISTAFDTDIQCRTVMTTSYTGIVQTTTSTMLKTKHAMHSKSVTKPPISTIYRDAITVAIGTTTSTRTRTIAAEAATNTVRRCSKTSISVEKRSNLTWD
jgi:hypothetical protein